MRSSVASHEAEALTKEDQSSCSSSSSSSLGCGGESMMRRQHCGSYAVNADPNRRRRRLTALEKVMACALLLCAVSTAVLALALFNSMAQSKDAAVAECSREEELGSRSMQFLAQQRPSLENVSYSIVDDTTTTSPEPESENLIDDVDYESAIEEELGRRMREKIDHRHSTFKRRFPRAQYRSSSAARSAQINR